MSPVPCLLPQIHRRFFAALLPWSVSLALVGLLAAPLPSAHAQPAEPPKAPELDGAVGPPLGADKPIKLKDLRGKIVVLEFWTLC